MYWIRSDLDYASAEVITQRKTQGAGQAQLYATDVGKIPDGMNKPQVPRLQKAPSRASCL